MEILTLLFLQKEVGTLELAGWNKSPAKLDPFDVYRLYGNSAHLV